MAAATQPGEWVHSATGLADIGADTFNTRIPTDRYTSRTSSARAGGHLDAGLADRWPGRRTAEGR